MQNEPVDHVMQFFAYAHLPPHLQAVSKPFGDLAEQIVATVPRNPERTKALNKLLEAKDAAVRALLAKDAPAVTARDTTGDRIRELRRKHGLTLEDTAKAMVVTIPEASDIERGNKTPNGQHLAALEKLFGEPI